MKPLPRLDVAIVALAATIAVALGVIAYAVLVLRPGDSPTSLVLATTTATPGAPTQTQLPLGPTAVPWVDSAPGPSPTVSPSPSPDSADLAVKACRAEDLVVGLDGSDGGNAGYGLYFAFANVSNEVCRLQGAPAAAVLDKDGVELQTVGVSGASCSGCPPFLLPPITPRPSPVFGKLAVKPGYVRLGLFWSSDMFRPTATPPRCNARGDSVRFELPDDRGDLLYTPVKNAEGGFLSGCEAPYVSQFYLLRQPQIPIKRLAVGIVAPVSVPAGSYLDYFVSLTNVSGQAIDFRDACPNYEEELDSKRSRVDHKLNCDQINLIDPGRTVVYSMHIDLPANLTAGTYDLFWGMPGLASAYTFINFTTPTRTPSP